MNTKDLIELGYRRCVADAQDIVAAWVRPGEMQLRAGEMTGHELQSATTILIGASELIGALYPRTEITEVSTRSREEWIELGYQRCTDDVLNTVTTCIRPSTMRLLAGQLTAQERRTAKAILDSISTSIGRLSPRTE